VSEQGTLDFLAALSPASEERIVWPNDMSFRLTAYLTHAEPPAHLLTSSRAIVLRADEVLVVRDPVNLHVWPGGRIEAGETLEQTARREVLEETGWHLGRVARIGFLHFEHLQPRPSDYPYAYPDFFQAVHAAIALEYDASARERDGYELGAEFRPLTELPQLSLLAAERALIDAAVAWRGTRDVA
jgi:8-oxo-dGTP pyrophosphatase MutT (NUDIX family)